MPIEQSIYESRSGKVPERVTALRGELPRPARSPDLSASDYFLWGYLKATRPRTIDESQFERQFQRCQKRWRGELWKNCGARLEVYVGNDRQHLSDVLFKTK
jgi:hypothetical protein